MKNIIALTLLACSVSMTACITSTPQRGTTTGSTSSVRTMSIEAEARKKTDDMDKVLALSAGQKDEIMVANTVYLKVIKNLQDNNESGKMDAAKQSYMNKLKSILSTEQYSKFESEMGD